MPGSDFPIFLGADQRPAEVQYFTPNTGETFVPGSLVYYDTATQTTKTCGTDPSIIAGISLVKATAVSGIYADGKGPVVLLRPDMLIGMSCYSQAPAETDVGVLYALIKLSSGNWAVDLTDTSDTRVIVVRVDIPNKVAYVRFIAANLQFDAIAS